ncbi:MAG: hypothetical protein INQ03_09975 [Candidatus Heimdallarchaeota archaeon]|nr:hypothetical protein [Candidatus Heimdallarchaeota archaeon]
MDRQALDSLPTHIKTKVLQLLSGLKITESWLRGFLLELRLLGEEPTPWLSTLQLRGNQLMLNIHGQMNTELITFPLSLFDLDLYEIRIRHPGLNYLPEEIGKLRNLNKIDIKAEKLQSLPAALQRMQVQYLFLEDCPLTSLQLPASLLGLSLIGIPVQHLDLGQLNLLRSLNIQQSPAYLSGVENLGLLEELHISNMQSIDHIRITSPHIHTIHLYNCNLTNLTRILPKQNNLHTISATSNRIKKLDFLEFCDSLVRLYMQDNELQFLPEVLINHPKLRFTDLIDLDNTTDTD